MPVIWWHKTVIAENKKLQRKLDGDEKKLLKGNKKK